MEKLLMSYEDLQRAIKLADQYEQIKTDIDSLNKLSEFFVQNNNKTALAFAPHLETEDGDECGCYACVISKQIDNSVKFTVSNRLSIHFINKILIEKRKEKTYLEEQLKKLNVKTDSTQNQQ